MISALNVPIYPSRYSKINLIKCSSVRFRKSILEGFCQQDFVNDLGHFRCIEDRAYLACNNAVPFIQH
eukprot:scaffold4880_cov106-Cylindrotheca_fusiformis.AAC.6